jgi:hypothetical protein
MAFSFSSLQLGESLSVSRQPFDPSDLTSNSLVPCSTGAMLDQDDTLIVGGRS